MFKAFILGAIQGIAEWIPVSSEGSIVLAQLYLFKETNVTEALDMALFLHIGTLLAALVYFRKDILHLIQALFAYKKQDFETQALLKFLIITTIISGALGYILLQLIDHYTSLFEVTGKVATIGISIALFVTATLLLLKKKEGVYRAEKELGFRDSLYLGLMQAFAVVPGISRSGSTVALLLLRKFKEETALRLSFLMSIPIVFAGALMLFSEGYGLNREGLIGILSSFIFGLVTIKFLMRIAERINFGKFVLLFAILTLISVFI